MIERDLGFEIVRDLSYLIARKFNVSNVVELYCGLLKEIKFIVNDLDALVEVFAVLNRLSRRTAYDRSAPL